MNWTVPDGTTQPDGGRHAGRSVPE